MDVHGPIESLCRLRAAIIMNIRREAPEVDSPERQLGVEGRREMRLKGPAHRSGSFVCRKRNAYKVQARAPLSHAA